MKEEHSIAKILLSIIGISNIIIVILQTVPNVDFITIAVQVALAWFLYRGKGWVRMLFIVVAFIGVFFIFSLYGDARYETWLLILVHLFTVFTLGILSFNSKVQSYFDAVKNTKNMEGEKNTKKRRKHR